MNKRVRYSHGDVYHHVEHFMRLTLTAYLMFKFTNEFLVKELIFALNFQYSG